MRSAPPVPLIQDNRHPLARHENSMYFADQRFYRVVVWIVGGASHPRKRQHGSLNVNWRLQGKSLIDVNSDFTA